MIGWGEPQGAADHERAWQRLDTFLVEQAVPALEQIAHAGFADRRMAPRADQEIAAGLLDELHAAVRDANREREET